MGRLLLKINGSDVEQRARRKRELARCDLKRVCAAEYLGNGYYTKLGQYQPFESTGIVIEMRWRL